MRGRQSGADLSRGGAERSCNAVAIRASMTAAHAVNVVLIAASVMRIRLR